LIYVLGELSSLALPARFRNDDASALHMGTLLVTQSGIQFRPVSRSPHVEHGSGRRVRPGP